MFAMKDFSSFAAGVCCEGKNSIGAMSGGHCSFFSIPVVVPCPAPVVAGAVYLLVEVEAEA
jgi:hypothetical protein